MSIETEKQKRKIAKDLIVLSKQIKDSQNTIRSAFLNIEETMRSALDNKEFFTNEEIVEIYSYLEDTFITTKQLYENLRPKDINDYE